MPAFNITTSHKYLVVCIPKWFKTNSFSDAVNRAPVGADIYEKVGHGKHADWFLLASIDERGNTIKEVLGDLPND